MSALSRLALLSALPLLATACASSPSGAPPASDAEPSASVSSQRSAPALVGTSWVLDALQGAAPVAGSTVTAFVESDGSVSGSGGCNRYRAKFTVTDGTLELDAPPVSTMMACDPAVMTQEAAFFKALEGVRSFTVEGTRLTLSDEADKPALTFTATSADLAGTAWTVTAFNTGAAVSSALAGTNPTLEFGVDGSVHGNTGCNTLAGPFTLGEGAVKIGPLVSTMMACAEPDGIMDQEKQLRAALESVTSYRVEADQLTLLAGDKTAVQLTRQTDH